MDSQTQEVADVINELGMVIGAVSSIEELAEAIPLAGVAPGGPEGLDLLASLGTATAALEATLAGIPDGPAEIADEIEAADTTVGGVNIAFGCAAGDGDSCGTPVQLDEVGGVIDYEVPVSATVTVAPDLLFESDVFDMAGNAIDLDLTLNTTLAIRFDTDPTNTEPFSLPNPPVITISVDDNAGLPNPITATSRIGIADVTVSLTGLDLDLGFTVTTIDPDNLDGLTRDEWLNTQIADLVSAIDGVTRSGTIAGLLNFDTDLIPGIVDGQLDIGDDLADGFDFALDPGDLGDLVDFTLISPSAIIAGIGQAAAGIGGAQAIGDLPLPFLDGAVRDLAQASRPILDAVDALGVVCGSEGVGNAAPAGPIEDLDAGQVVYCRAIVTSGVAPDSVEWSPIGASPVANTIGASANGTVGISPSINAEFTMDAPGDFDVQVTYTATFDDDNDEATPPLTESRVSTLPPYSLQDLAEELDALGAFDALPEDLIAYDQATHALRVDLAKSFDPDPVEIPINVGNQLEAGTGVAGLQTTDGSITADASGVAIDLTAGVFLLPPDEWDTVTVDGGCPDPSVVGTCADALNLFFVEVDTAAGAYEFVVDDASFGLSAPTPQLTGSLGYLAVEAEVAAFGLAKHDPASPVFSVDLEPGGELQLDGTPIADAISLRELLFDIVDRTEVGPLNLAFNGQFDVAGSLDGVEVASASASVTWAPVFEGLPQVDASSQTAFADAFANFNPLPNLFGTHSGADSPTVLNAAGGVTFDSDSAGSRVVNMVDGSSCEITTATGNQLTCTEGLAGGADNTWQDGDLYRVEIGSPLAMLEALLDKLDQIVEAIDNATGGDLGAALDTEIPVVGVSPRVLLDQIGEIGRTIDEIRRPAADVVCGLSHDGTGGITDDPSELVLEGGSATIYCNALHNKPATDVAWSVGDIPGVVVVVTPPADPATTVGSPTDAVTITFTGAADAVVPQRILGDADADDGFQVNLAFNDNDGSHDAEYPSLSQPATIQQLEDVVRDKLGAGSGFGLSLDDIGGTDVVVLDLQVGRCNDDALCPGQANSDPLTTALNADIVGSGGLVSASSSGDIDVNYNAEARLQVAFGLAAGAPQVWVMPDTGLTLEGQFSASDLNFEAAFGPLAVVAGSDVVDDNGTPDDTSDDRGGLGAVQLGASLNVGGPAHIPSPVELATFLGGLDGYLEPEFSSSDANDCGTIITDRGPDLADPSDDTTQPLSGIGCAAISIGLEAGGTTSYVADLGLTVDVVGGKLEVTPHIPVDLLTQLASAALDFELLLKALPEVIGSVETALRASASDDAGNAKVPLIGDALDAGADVAGQLRVVTETIVDSIPPAVYEADTVDGLESALRTFIYDELSTTGLLLKADGTEIANASEIEVISECGGCDKLAAGSSVSIQDLRVIFAIGQIAEIQELPFDLGMDGVPLKLAGSLAPEATWHYVIDLGLSRTEGPYIGVGDPGTNVRNDAELTLSAGVGLGSAPAECTDLPPVELSVGGIFSTDRCLSGQIAFLGVNANDSVDKPSHVGVEVSLDLTNDGADTLSFSNAADVSLEPSVEIAANVDLFFRTGIVGGQDAGFPSVVGTFALDWAFGTENRPLTVAFDDLHLDVGPLVTNFIEPIAAEIRRFTGPFQPIIETLTAPIPVVSDLAALVGQPPVTLLGLMEIISGNDLSLIQSIAAFISFVNSPLSGSGYFPLGAGGVAGAFGVDPDGAREGQGPTSAADLVTGSNAGTASLLSIGAVGGDASALTAKAAEPTPSTKADLPGTFGVPGLTFPFLDNPSQIFGLLLGQDITLVRYDFGPLEASAGFSYNFPPIMVGPVPIGIGVGGSVTVKGRFAVGYDTSGLRKVLSGGSGLYLFDGIFIDDLDVNGVDVPEISFIGEVYAQAGITLGIASAGIVAGLRITVDLNLDDSPDPDGKLRIEEIFNKLQNPICLFDISGRLEAFIRAFVELDLFLVSLRFEFTILEIELLNFSGKCEPPKPQLAEVSGTTLILNVGSRADQRNIAAEEEDEEFTVRPINDQGGFSVSAFGVYQTYGIGGEFDSGIAITAISANAAAGDDTLQMLPGGDQEEPPENPDDQPAEATPDNTEIPFTISVNLDGGDDNDVLVSGDGADTLNGGKGDDRLEGGAGIDTLNGGDGNDTLNGDAGNDILNGGNNEDTIQGGPGNDIADGGAGADLVQGGPGTDVEGGTDGDDMLAGGPGPDTVEGGTGEDSVFGDEQPADFENVTVCAADTADLGDPSDDGDKVSGGDGDDTVYGGHGDDELFGGSGNDLLCGNQGADLIDGDLGSETTENDENDDAQVDTSGGDDRAHGGNGNDTVRGNWGNDYVLGDGGGDIVDGDEGNDDVAGGAGGDLLRGGVGIDLMVGDIAPLDQSNDKSTRTTAAALDAEGLVGALAPGSGGTPNCSTFGDSAGLADCIRGGDGGDVIWGEGGDDDIDGGDGDDIIRGNDGDDRDLRGGKGADVMFGNDGEDVMFGDSGDDEMYGNAGVDVMRGLADDDYMEGNGGSDIMLGDGGQDDMIGGSSASAAPDEGDIMAGGALADVMVGDNGEIVRPSGDDTEPDDSSVIVRDVTLYDVNSNAIGGADSMFGNSSNDRMFGGNQDDTMSGGDGRDLMEGNDGNDAIRGNDGPDRIVGGSSSRAELLSALLLPVPYDEARDNSSDGTPSGDDLGGGDGPDVIAGDNALADIDGSVQMTADNMTIVYGADLIRGNDGQDRLYGQLGGDTMFGGADEDYLVGDLGFVAATPTKTWPGGAPDYDVDLDQPGPDVVGIGDPALGADVMQGDGADDHLFGGAGDDDMRGNADDDYMEGNGGIDEMYGNAPNFDDGNDEDDMIGGSSSWTRDDDVRLDDGELLMQGNGDHDVMAGDNADILRIVDPGDATQWAPDEVTPGRKRIVVLLDREKLGSAQADVSGADHIQGNDGSDREFGQGGSDLVQGNADDDLIEGNQGGDWLEGNDGEDDIIGGSSQLASNDGAPQNGAGADLGDPDGGDAIFGGADADVIAGDNAVVVRRTPANEVAYQAALSSGGLDAPYFTSDHLDAVPGWWLGPETDRLVRLLDRSNIHPGRYGADIISAGAGEDALFAQDGGDWTTGGGGDDTAEGNGGPDTMVGDRSPEAAGAPTYTFGERDWEGLGLVSIGAARDGAIEADGEDDLVGGSNEVHRDGDDLVEGNGEDDFILGDNGTLQRQISAEAYVDHVGDGARERIFRRAERFGVASPDAGVFGDDDLFGNSGDDAIWGQDGDDDVRGQAGDDDLIGELGDDLVYGGAGEDAMIGDRGSILNSELGDGGALFVEAQETKSYNGPPFLDDVEYFTTGRYDRRVDLLVEVAGSVGGPFPGSADVGLASDGLVSGGDDLMRGGPDHDSMHGAFGDDLMNGDDGGDWMFGADGSDVMWGGRGDPDGLPTLGDDYVLVDRLFGGHGGDPTVGEGINTGGADILDFKPRKAGEGPYIDPVEWVEATSPYDDGTGSGGSTTTQHHQGTDWIYGGWDRDVMEGNVTTQGPNVGDRLWDWTGTFNLWTHCAPDYGGFNDIRARSPQMEQFLEQLAYDSGVGDAIAQVQDSSSSAYRELGLVYKKDTKSNSGKAYPTTPGHFDEPAACDDN